MNKNELLNYLKNEIIVSCQALPGEPLHGFQVMGRLALAAQLGGAKGIRANGISDIRDIKKEVKLPIIGIIKAEYSNSNVYITPTAKEVRALLEEKIEIIALDFTNRERPKESLSDLVKLIRNLDSEVLIMADCDTKESVDTAELLGADIIGTTLSGYTRDTQQIQLPNISLVSYASQAGKPVFCEGGIQSIEDVKNAFSAGAHTCVIGGAITRPQDITKKFLQYKK